MSVDEPRTPFWKKEISLGRRKADEPEPAVEGGEQELEATVLERLAAFVAPIEPEPVEPVVDLVVPPADVAPAPAVEPAEGAAYDWLTEEISPQAEPVSWVERVDDAPPAVAVPEPVAPVEPEPVAPVEPGYVAPVELEVAAPAEPAPFVVPEAVAPPEPETPTPAAFAAPAPVVPPRPTVPEPLPGIHPPVRAEELPPLAGEEPATSEPKQRSGLRRELSFRRKAKAEHEPREKPTPFWKKELGRKQPEAEVEAEEPKRPFWKRDLGKRAPAAEREQRPKRKRQKGRHKKVVGLKIGASQIAAARVTNNGAAQLLQVARDPLEPGVVVGGELRDPDALAEALKGFFRRHKLPRRGVRLGIANNRIGVRSFDLDGIEDPKQLENAIRFRAQEALPIPIEEAVLDYQVLGERIDEEGRTIRRVLLVVAYRELIDRYADACRKAGIRLVGIDLEPFALLRALAEPREESSKPPEAATVAVAVGYDRATFAVSDGRVCEFTRVLEWGGFSVNVAIARALDIAPSEAEPVKRALSLEAEDVPEGLSPEQAAAARDAIRKQVASFARELVSSLQFYQSQPGSLSIAGITVTGGAAHMPGFAAELQRLIGVPVEVGDPLTRVRPAKKLKTDDQLGSLAVAIGLGIED